MFVNCLLEEYSMEIYMMVMVMVMAGKKVKIHVEQEYQSEYHVYPVGYAQIFHYVLEL